MIKTENKRIRSDYRKMIVSVFWGFTMLIVSFPGWFAGEMPLIYRNSKGELSFNLFKSNSVSGNRAFLNGEEIIISPPVPFHPTRANLEEGRFIRPLGYGTSGKIHWLGTDHLGRDVLAGIVWGARNSLLVAILAGITAFLISFVTGSAAGYFGDTGFRTGRYGLACFLLAALSFLIFFQWHFNGVGGYWQWGILSAGTGFCLSVFLFRQKRASYTIAIDKYLSSFINIFDSVPALIIAIVFFLSYPGVNILNLSAIIGILKIPTFYRIVRSEIRRVKNKPYVLAARVSGKTGGNLLVREMLPNILPALTVHGLYTIASVIIIESTISFLNLGGVNPGYISWGKQLSLSRNYIGEWWLAVFPGLCIFLTIITLRRWAKKIATTSNYEF